MNTIGKHIRNIRKSNNLTLKQLSEKSDISIPFLSDIERDVVNPSLKSLEMIAIALELSLPEIVNYKGDLEHRLINENRSLKDLLSKVRLLLTA